MSRNLIIVPRFILRYRIGRTVTHPKTLLTGAGAKMKMRQALGIAVFFGMLGVTFFGLVFTPTFYVVFRAVSDRLPKPPRVLGPAPAPEPAE